MHAEERKMKASIVSYILLLVSAVSVNADTCFIDGALVPRCLGIKMDNGVSWPVFTADTPIDVMRESDNHALQFGSLVPYRLRAELPIFTKVLDIDVEKYPDVVCFDFYSKGLKHAQTCFDPMEITER